MTQEFEIAAVVSGASRPDELAKALRLFGCRPEVVIDEDLTVLVNRESAASACRAMAAFMRHLANAQVKFDYIMVGAAGEALDGYRLDVLSDHDDTPRQVA